MKKVNSWDNTKETQSFENKKFSDCRGNYSLRLPLWMLDQMNLLSMRSKRDKSIFVRHWIAEGLRQEAAKEKIRLWPLERRLSL